VFATAQKEQFSLAYVHAVAAVAGFNVGRWEVDDDSADMEIKAKGLIGAVRSPHIELQLKCTQNLEVYDDANWKFNLKKKNYDDLRATDLHVPKLLVVLQVPVDTDEWVSHTVYEMSLRRCAFWRCLYGQPALPEGQLSKTVTVSRDNVFNPDGLIGIVDRIGQGIKAL
jgi:hypothetical protein